MSALARAHLLKSKILALPGGSSLLNMALRIVSMAAKMVLTLYMGRYLELGEMGIYGLVFSGVMISSLVLGFEMTFAVSREIVGAPPLALASKLRDEAVFYIASSFLLALGLAGMAAWGLLPFRAAALIFFLSLSESLASVSETNITALGRPLLANALFFLRAGLWAVPVALLGFLFPSWRHVEPILGAWFLGNLLSLAGVLWSLRALPWRQAWALPLDRVWIVRNLQRTLPIWLGTMADSVNLYSDRFVVQHFLGVEKVGVLTFFSSFAMALMPLTQSGVYALIYPRLIRYEKEGQTEAFWHLAKRMALGAVGVTLVLALAMGFAVPWLCSFLGREAFLAEEKALWFLLGGVGMWCLVNIPYYILFARHQDRALWVGRLLVVVPALCGNVLLVPRFGLAGVGISSMCAASLLMAWEFFFVFRGRAKKTLKVKEG